MQTEIKRNILWVVFLTSLFILWDNWMVSNGHPSVFAPPPPKVASKAPTAAKAELLPAAGASASTVANPAAPAPAAAPTAPFKSELITLTTDVFKVDIDTLGGEIKRLELLKFKDGIDPKKNQVLFNVTDNSTYLTQSGLIGNAANGLALPNHSSGYIAKPGIRTLATGNNEVQLALESEQGGVKFAKIYTFKRGDYKIGIKYEVSNQSGSPIAPTLSLAILHDGNKPVGDNFFMSSYTGPSVYSEAEKFEKLEFSEIESKKAKHIQSADNGWFGIVQHFFVSAYLPPDKIKRDVFTKKIDTNLYAVGNKIAMGTIANGASTSLDVGLYSGPQETQRLERTAPGLDLVKDYGMLTMIAKPMFWMMETLHNMLGNWGWTIVVFTVIIKLALFPLSAAGFRSMAKMKVVTPKIQAIRDRHKNDPQKMNQAMMELYKSEKINPLGGCLPILVQMPIFIALYWVLLASVEIRNAPWIGWIHDLAAPDPWYILPVIYAISMYITAKLNPAPADPMQAKMMLYMPLVFSVMFFFFPSGLVLYWVVNNILSIAQQWVITRQYETKT